MKWLIWLGATFRRGWVSMPWYHHLVNFALMGLWTLGLQSLGLSWVVWVPACLVGDVFIAFFTCWVFQDAEPTDHAARVGESLTAAHRAAHAIPAVLYRNFDSVAEIHAALARYVLIERGLCYKGRVELTVQDSRLPDGTLHSTRLELRLLDLAGNDSAK